MTEQLGITWGSDRAGYHRIRMLDRLFLDNYWRAVQELLAESPEQWNRHYTLEGIYKRLKSGEAQFWFASDDTGPFLGMMTEVAAYETGLKELRVNWIGGSELRELDEYFFLFEEWARIQGCTEVATHCRPAVKRMMEKYGFKDRSYVITKSITYGKEH